MSAIRRLSWAPGATARLALAALLTGGLLGCASARVNYSNRVPGVAIAEPQRLFVFESLAPGGLNLRRSEFPPLLTAALQSCGIATQIVTVPARPTNAPGDGGEANRRLAADGIRAFQPDSILELSQLTRTSHGLNTSSATYTLALFDMASQQTVWRADVTLAAHGWDGYTTLAKAVVNRLADDGILRRCPPPGAVGRVTR
jgi:hypothetical protein